MLLLCVPEKEPPGCSRGKLQFVKGGYVFTVYIYIHKGGYIFTEKKIKRFHTLKQSLLT